MTETEGKTPRSFGISRPTSETEGIAESKFGRKLDMPIFGGDNPEGWVFRAERYFHLNQLTEGEKLLAASVYLDRDVLTWFGWRELRAVFLS